MASSVRRPRAGGDHRTGAYEPIDLEVFSVEPSTTMIAQRPERSAPVIQGSAENLPLPDGSLTPPWAVFTIHHWSDVRAGLRELRGVASRCVVIFLRDPRVR
jgi:ubiquinone/menaquinone biosynthesis C-methylase UbiE